MLISKRRWQDLQARMDLPEGTIVNAPSSCCAGSFPRVTFTMDKFGHRGNPRLICPTCRRQFKTI